MCMPSSTTGCTSCWRRRQEVAAECRCLVMPQWRLQSQHECSVTPPRCRLPRGWLWACQCPPMVLCTVSSAVRNPPATTIILSSGAWAISSLESRSARSCLLEGTARKSFQFWDSGTVLSSTIFLIGRAFLYRFLWVPLLVELSM